MDFSKAEIKMLLDILNDFDFEYGYHYPQDEDGKLYDKDNDGNVVYQSAGLDDMITFNQLVQKLSLASNK